MRIPFLLATALVAGCAGLSEGECRSANWAELGRRDGSMGTYLQIDQHAHHCGQFGVKVDEQAYMTAWREAYADWSMRTNPGSGDN
jgi:hypothetical protein